MNLSVEHLKLSEKDLNLSPKHLKLSVEHLNLSENDLNLSLEHLMLSVEHFIYAIRYFQCRIPILGFLIRRKKCFHPPAPAVVFQIEILRGRGMKWGFILPWVAPMATELQHLRRWC